MRQEKAPLLRPWKEKGTPGRNGWTVVFGWIRHWFIPGFLFALTSISFMLGYHNFAFPLVVTSAFFCVAFFIDALYLWSLKKSVTKNSLAFAVMAFAIFAGGVIGMSINLTHLYDYWPFYDKRHYTNVAPDEPAATRADASVLVFMEGARPDGSRAVGYRRYGHTYCVAPIVVEDGYSDEQAVSSDIQYWAVGKDCCTRQLGFTCDDAQSPKARSGLVMGERTGDGNYLNSLVMPDEWSFYDKAVLMGLTKFDLTSPKERLFVRFVKNIDSAREGYWSAAWWFWWKMQAMFLTFFMACAAATVLIGAGDKQDDARYNEHIIDAQQSVLFNINQYI